MARCWGTGLVIAALLLPAAGAVAATPTWSHARLIEPGGHSIAGLSCASAATCAAASSAPVLEDGGPSFEPAASPGSAALTAVSCVGGTRSCMFADAAGGVFPYIDGSFSGETNIDGAVPVQSVTCPTTTMCMAIDGADKVFRMSSGLWDLGTALATGGTFTGHDLVSCASPTFCIAVASTSAGERYSSYNGANWTSVVTPFTAGAASSLSLSCTSSTFCLATGEDGGASKFNGTTWSTVAVEAGTALRSACAGTNCLAIDPAGNVFSTSDGTNWGPGTPAKIDASTGLGTITSIACATSSLCVVGDSAGRTTTYTNAVTTGPPSIAGTAIIGSTLTLTPAPVAAAPAWTQDAWRRCDGPATGCAAAAISTSPSSYVLGSADAGKDIDVVETIGSGFDEQAVASNAIGPVGDGTSPPPPPPPKAGHIKVGKASSTRRGIVTVGVRCSGGSCRGRVTLRSGKSSLGSKRYAIAAGHSVNVRITLGRAGRKLVGKHRRSLVLTLVIAPRGAKATHRRIRITIRG